MTATLPSIEREIDSRLDLCVLVLAPIGQDGRMIVECLRAAGIDAAIRPTMPALCSDLHNCAAALFTIEAADQFNLELFQSALRAQPAWSDVPVILLANQPNVQFAESIVRKLGNLTIVQRPINQSYLVSVVQSAIRARIRQYQVRDLLEDSQAQQSEISALNERLHRSMTETHHRVKNNLQVIAAMVDMQAMEHEASVPTNEIK